MAGTFTLVIVIQRSNCSVFVEPERHHTIGACHVDERARGHCGVAAIWAFRNRSRCIARNLRAARRACHRPQTVALAFVPRGAREKRRNGLVALACVAACRGSGIQHILGQGHRNAVGCTHGLKRAHLAGSRTLGCGHRRRIGLRLLGGIVRLNLRNFKRTFTVVADHEAFRLRKMQGSATCGALVVHRFDSHENSFLASKTGSRKTPHPITPRWPKISPRHDPLDPKSPRKQQRIYAYRKTSQLQYESKQNERSSRPFGHKFLRFDIQLALRNRLFARIGLDAYEGHSVTARFQRDGVVGKLAGRSIAVDGHIELSRALRLPRNVHSLVEHDE